MAARERSAVAPLDSSSGSIRTNAVKATLKTGLNQYLFKRGDLR